ncbi:MAG: hypothetical protein A2231_12640 [Candidatus Firestonebacteria bacterium RIFOXYA2_FULL_40_8]|nr:MAG: hypothetical protein A2231_12640 [Candidatus Firestonebacteria bacterium RIFOXYA2_FULL_40_8]
MNLSRIFTGVIFIVVLLVLMFTTCPVVYVGDTGEVVAAAHSLGIAHPPGYPLYTTLGHIFSYLPLSNIAFRVNLLAAFLAALAAALFFKLLIKLSESLKLTSDLTPFFALTSALLLAFSRTFWAQGVMAKGGIYHLNLIFIIAIIILLVQVLQKSDKNALLLLSFLSGLSMANHHTMLAVIGLTYIFIFIFQRKLFFKYFLGIVLLIGAGLLYYLYLPIRAAANPSMNWGNPVNFQAMLDVVTRNQYGRIGKGDRGAFLYLAQLWEFVKSFSLQFTVFILPLVIAGAYAFYKKSKRMFAYFGVLFILFSAYMLYTTNPKLTTNDLEVVEVFFIPAYTAAAVFIFFGLVFLAGYIKEEKAKRIFAVSSVMLFVLLVFSNFHFNDRSNNYLAANYGMNMLKTPEKNSILFASQDNEVFILAYYKKVEKVRPDITVYEDLGCVFDNIYGEDMMRVGMLDHERKKKAVQIKVVENNKDRPIYYLRTSSMFKWMAGKGTQAGIMFKLGVPPKKDYFASYNLTGLDDKTIWKEYMLRDTVAQYLFSEGELAMTSGDQKKGFEYFDKARDAGEDISWVNNNIGIFLDNMGMIDAAMENYKKAIAANPKSPVARYNLGIIYKKKKMLAEAEAEYKEAIRLNPDYYDALNNLGSMFVNNGRAVEAEEYLTRAVYVNPESADAYFNLGVAKNDQKKYDEALKVFDQTLKLNPNYAEAYNGKAFSYFYKDDIDKALEMCVLALKINPNFKEAATNYQRLKQMKGGR